MQLKKTWKEKIEHARGGGETLDQSIAPLHLNGTTHKPSISNTAVLFVAAFVSDSLCSQQKDRHGWHVCGWGSTKSGCMDVQI